MADLAKSAEKLQDAETWRWTGQSPVTAIGELHRVLLDLRQVFGYAAAAPERLRSLRARLGRSSRRNSALARAAAEARKYADALAAMNCRKLEEASAERGLLARTFIRPAPKDDGFRWPSVEYCVAIVVNELVDYLVALPLLEQIFSAARVDAQVTFVPEMRERIAPIALLTLRDVFLPHPTFASDWRDFVDRPILEGGKADVFIAAVNSLAAMSAIISDRGRELNEPERIYLERFRGRVAEHLSALANREQLVANPALVGPTQFLLDLCTRLEADAAKGTQSASPLAVEFAESMVSAGGELWQQIVVHRLTLMQQDLLAQ